MKHIFWLLVIGLMGCASSPDIPADTGPVQYRSTGETAEEPAPLPDLVTEQQLVRAKGPVATVDGSEISAKAFNDEIQRVVSSGMPPAMANRFKENLIDKLIERRLLEGALKKEGIQVSAQEQAAKLAEVQAEFARAAQQSGVTLDDLVKQLGITQKELEESIEQSIAIEKMLIKRGMAEPAEEDVKRYYDENPAQFNQPEAVHARHILIKVEPGATDETWKEAKKEADKVAKQARAKNANFVELARQHSHGPTKETGGDLGFVPRGTTVEDFEGPLFDLEPGQVSDPVRTPFGWHIIKVEAKRPEGTVPYEEVKDQLSAQFKGQTTRDALESYLADLKSGAKIEIHRENIE